jgi:ABC-type glycerol-3-phosphate transport system permease component
MCFLIGLPIISMIGTSLKTENTALSTTTMFPKLNEIYWGNFPAVLKTSVFPRSIINSAFVSVISSIFCVIIASLAGYAVSRFHAPVFKMFSALLLVMQMMPLILILVPTFIIYRRFGLQNTLQGLIVNYTSTNLAFSVWLLKGFFDSIPLELDEAAMIDGCGRFAAFQRVVLPIAAPGLSTVAIFTFVRAWNEYMVARTLILSDAYKTINLGLQLFVQQYDINWALLSAAAVIATVPTILFLLFAQKYLVQGLTSGAVKG